MLRSFVYRHRLAGKRVLASLIRFAPSSVSARLRSLADQIAFRLVPGYQGETLPPIFHVWSNRFLKPQLEQLEIGSPEKFYLGRTLQMAKNLGRQLQLVSLGAGGCAMEIQLARHLRERGVDAHIECVDFNPSLMASARASAREAGLLDMLSFSVRDINTDPGRAGKDVVLVNQFFHHIQDLDFACRDIARILDEDGVLLTCDIVGRNGHVLWPSVAEVVDQHWAQLRREKRYDRHFSRELPSYESVDHAAYSSEGVHAQDVVEKLLEYFDFEVFFTYGAAIMPFVERRVGFNFDPADAHDLHLITSIAADDQRRVERQEYPASNMIAALRHKGRCGTTWHIPVAPAQHIRMTQSQLRLARTGAPCPSEN
jgi:SAM-dependent methyltransferase